MGNIIMALIVAIVVLGSCSNNKKDNMENKVTTSTHKTKKKVVDYGELATVYLSTEDFKQKVMNYEKHPQEWVFEGSRPAVIDFYATWCGPCKMTAPIIERLARQYKIKAKSISIKLILTKNASLHNYLAYKAFLHFCSFLC